MSRYSEYALDEADFAEMTPGHFVAPLEEDIDMWAPNAAIAKKRLTAEAAYSAKAAEDSVGKGWKVVISIATVLVIIGALNWLVVGSTGLSNPNAAFDLFKPTLGQLWAPLPYIIYLLVGIAGIVLIWALIVRSMRRSKAKKMAMSDDFLTPIEGY
jgi:uncharacterized membrane protein YuzA (DUF378 family)